MALLLLEGVPGIGKTTIADALVRAIAAEAPPRQIRSLLHLSQGEPDAR